MQNNLILIICLLFFSSIAHKTKLQDALQSNAKFFNEIKGEKLGKLLINLSQISTENDYDSLYDALDALLSDFEQKFKTQQELYEEAERLYKSAITNYESKIESLEITLADLQQDLNNNLEPEYTQIQEELETLQERIEKIQQQIIDFTNIRNKEKTENDKRNKDLTDALEAIDETLELLQSLASENSENVESVSLIQNKKQSLFQVKNRLQKKLGNIRNSFEYKPIIEALTQITLNDDYVDQTILRKVTDLLQEIRNEFNEMSYSIQQQEEQAQINFESTIANYNDDLELSQRLYKENTSKLGDLKAKISEINERIQQSNEELDQTKELYELKNTNWQQYEQYYVALSEEMERIRSIFEQATDIFNNAGITRSSY